MDVLKTLGGYGLGAIMFAGWPVFLFLIFHTRVYGAAIVVALSILTFFIGSAIASVGAAIHSPLPLYGWLALPYALTLALLVRRRRGLANASRNIPSDSNI